MERLFLYINLIEKRNSNDITFFYPSLFTDWSHAGDVSVLCASETLLQAPENCSEWFSTGVRPAFFSCDGWQRKENLPSLSTGAQLAQPGAVTVTGSERASSAFTSCDCKASSQWLQVYSMWSTLKWSSSWGEIL